MDRIRAEIMLTDILAGENTAKELDDLSRYEVANPSFLKYRERLEIVWGLGASEGCAVEAGNELFRAKISCIVGKVTHAARTGSKLSLDALDRLSAAGTNLQENEQDIDK